MVPKSIRRSVFPYSETSVPACEENERFHHGLDIVGREAHECTPIPENIAAPIIRSYAITSRRRVSARLDTRAPSLIIFLYFLSLQELYWVGSTKVLIVVFKVVINPPSVQ